MVERTDIGVDVGADEQWHFLIRGRRTRRSRWDLISGDPRAEQVEKKLLGKRLGERQLLFTIPIFEAS